MNSGARLLNYICKLILVPNVFLHEGQERIICMIILFLVIPILSSVNFRSTRLDFIISYIVIDWLRPKVIACSFRLGIILDFLISGTVETMTVFCYGGWIHVHILHLGETSHAGIVFSLYASLFSSDFTAKVVDLDTNDQKDFVGHKAPILAVAIDPVNEYLVCDVGFKCWVISK